MGLQDFQLNGRPVVIERFTGEYGVDGVFRRTLDSVFTAIGSMQPYKTIAPTEIFRPPAGEYVEQRVILYLNIKLYMNDNTRLHPVSDLVRVDGRTYKPVSVENWNYGNRCSVNHYRYVLELFDGY